ncbi:NUDIX domain-containing protein [Streptomyces mirabilis]|uniref:NUDIX domain-containing protein n=1 Tax=Streptomyces mirabilis TaxID=68239 RepID=UPI0037F121D6
MSVVYKDTDGYPSIGFDTYTVEQLADLIADAFVSPEPGTMLPLDRAAANGFALHAAKAIVHRNDPKPVSSVPAATELVDLVDRHGTTRKTGIPRTQADHLDGLYLPIVLVVITHIDGRILIHQRATTKTQPGAIDHVCGAIRSGETPDEAAHRETREETGATLTSLRLVHAGVNEHGRYRHLYVATNSNPGRRPGG